VNEYVFARLRQKYKILGRAYLSLAHELKNLTADLAVLRAELRSAQNELERLKRIDRAQRAERTDGAPLQ
jgi:hypothetical protein